MNDCPRSHSQYLSRPGFEPRPHIRSYSCQGGGERPGWLFDGVFYPDETPGQRNAQARPQIRASPTPGPQPHASSPTPAAPLQGLEEESLDSEIGSRNAFAPFIILLSLTPPPPALFFF